MQEGPEAMIIALRVLTALMDNLYPDPADVEKLHQLAPARGSAAPLDELACDVIQKALKHRAMLRDA